MAQSAVPVNEDRTDLLGIPPFWAKASINPPFFWESWIGQFFLAAQTNYFSEISCIVCSTAQHLCGIGGYQSYARLGAVISFSKFWAVHQKIFSRGECREATFGTSLFNLSFCSLTADLY